MPSIGRDGEHHEETNQHLTHVAERIRHTSPESQGLRASRSSRGHGAPPLEAAPGPRDAAPAHFPEARVHMHQPREDPETDRRLLALEKQVLEELDKPRVHLLVSQVVQGGVTQELQEALHALPVALADLRRDGPLEQQRAPPAESVQALVEVVRQPVGPPPAEKPGSGTPRRNGDAEP